MTTKDFTTSLVVDQTAEEVFNAIINVRGWWSEEIEGNTEKLNDEFTYHYKDVHIAKMKLIEVITNKKVVWLVVNNHFNFTKNDKEWTGNKIVFEIAEKDNKTRIQFTQLGLVPQDECYEICENAWNNYINNSLYKLITTGKGEPTGKESATADFTTTIVVDQTPEEVFNAVTDVRGWWSEEIEGNTEKLNDEFTYHYRDVHIAKIKLLEVIPNKKVVWLVVNNRFNFTKDETEWTGNKIVFEITKKDNNTLLQFTQLGLVPQYECYEICRDAWTNYINNSLRNLITTGKGEPNGKESEFEEQLLVQHEK